MEEINTRDKQGKKLIGKVSPEERDSIKTLFERKNALIELFHSLTNDDKENSNNLYEKIVEDMGIVSAKFKNWWLEKSTKYNWENIKGYRWEIDFNSCEIFLVKDRGKSNEKSR